MGRRPSGQPIVENLRGDVEIDAARIQVDGHQVAFGQQRDGAAASRFGGDVAHHESLGCAAEPAVCDQRHAFREARADDRAGDAEHLAHTRPAARTFVADHEHVAFFDAAVGDGLHGGLFGVEHSSASAVFLAGEAGHLDDAAVGRERAP